MRRHHKSQGHNNKIKGGRNECFHWSCQRKEASGNFRASDEKQVTLESVRVKSPCATYPNQYF